LVTRGVFHPNAVFRVLPAIPVELLEQVPDRSEHLARYSGWASQETVPAVKQGPFRLETAALRGIEDAFVR